MQSENQCGHAALNSAVSGGNLDRVQLLLQRTDIDANKANVNGKTVLHIAVGNRDLQVVQLLLETTKIDPNRKDGYKGDTPLHKAAKDRNLDIVKLLLERPDIDLSKENWLHDLGLPIEIKALDKDSAKVFTHLLEEESYSHFEARVMLAGEQGTGKTTIARYLIGKGPTRFRKSTDGIGLYAGLSYIERETEEWLDGKQEELTKGRSLRQKTSKCPTLNLKPGQFAGLGNHNKDNLKAGASYQLKKQQGMVGINVNKISEVLYDRSEQQGSFNRSTEYIKIIDEERSTVPPSFDAQQCNTQDGNFVPNVLLDFDIEQKISKGAKTFK
ncbi:unnamed protein product [Mytilus edulis]|uniref:Uncharacterized protein n=1 Tax=Mytilus edulis TaxID=6550 RepID=A0A8S3UBE2_MYTED|nr:unnamed protein product [Mytilus edulis]